MDAEHLPDSILIVDFGSQVTQLIARRVREAGVYSEIAPFSLAEEAFHRLRPKGIILSGSPAGVPEEGSPRAPQGQRFMVATRRKRAGKTACPVIRAIAILPSSSG